MNAPVEPVVNDIPIGTSYYQSLFELLYPQHKEKTLRCIASMHSKYNILAIKRFCKGALEEEERIRKDIRNLFLRRTPFSRQEAEFLAAVLGGDSSFWFTASLIFWLDACIDPDLKVDKEVFRLYSGLKNFFPREE